MKSFFATCISAVVLTMVVCVVMLTHIPQSNVIAQNAYQVGAFGNLGFPVNLTITAQTQTLTASQMVGEVITSFAGATTLTTASATDLCALFPFFGNSPNAMGYAWDWYLKSAAGNTNVIPTAGAGITVVGLGTTAASSVRHFKIVLTTCPIPGTAAPVAAVTMHSLETTTF